ncbi:MAG: zinc-ribbon domain-containing protein [Rhizobiales bacterium]|nr:zinc-ribbon domain-containing protein [Hyphomicrobiales bacterium]
MQIICPHCTTSYAVDPAKFGAAGRTVRCARCHETWLAQPEEMAAASAHAGPGRGDDWGETPADDGWREDVAPHVESPSIASGWPEGGEAAHANDDTGSDWPDEEPPEGGRKLPQLLRGIARPAWLTESLAYVKAHPPARLPAINLNIACGVMAALTMALIFWRADVVRLMPQTASFFQLVGLPVNLRGLAFADMKISTETVNGKPVLVIEGAIHDVARKPVDLPRLRFIARNAQGNEIYAWNSVLEQAKLQPGEKIWFKSRLASPPAEGREIAVRFFHPRDIAAGGV